MIYSLSELAANIKVSTQKTIMLEVGIMKLCSANEQSHTVAISAENTQAVSNVTSSQNTQKISSEEIYQIQKNNSQMKTDIDNKIKQLENKIGQLSNLIIHNSATNVDNTSENPAKKQNKLTKNTHVNNGPTNIVKNTSPTGKKLDSWGKIVNGLKDDGKIMLYTNLMNTTATEINDMTVGIVFKNGITPFGRSVLDKPESVSELTKVLSLEYGKPMQVKYIDSKVEPVIHDGAEEFASEVDVPVNIIDE